MNNATPDRRKPPLWLLLKVAVSVGLLVYLWQHMQFQVQDWPTAHIIWFVPALVVLMVQPVIGALRWHVILRGFGAALSIKDAVRIHLIGCFFNVFLPASAGGDAVRVWYAGRQGVQTKVALQSVLADRLMALVAVIVMIALALPWAVRIIQDHAVLLVLQTATGLALGGMVVALLAHNGLQRWRDKAWARFFLWPLHILHTVVGRYKIAVPSLAISLIVHAMTCVATGLIAQGYGIHLTLPQIFVLVPPVILALGLPISLGGWGAREMAMVGALAVAGVPAPIAFTLSLTLGMLFTLANLPGLAMWFIAPHVKGQMK